MKPLPKSSFRCPDCRQAALRFSEDRVVCDSCASVFPVVNGNPVLLAHDNPFFPVVAAARPPETSWIRRVRRLVPRPGVNLSRTPSLRLLVEEAARRNGAFVLVVGSAEQKNELADLFAAYPTVTPVYSDVDPDAHVDLYCDAQELPFVDGTFSAAIITGVLNSTPYPEQAVAELQRALAEGGLVYSEAPFVQHVAFGAHDFHRFTLAGHRHLFRRFREISSGMVAGPATVLYWAVESLVLTLLPARGRLVGKGLLRTCLSWIKYLDYLLRRRPAAVDGASNTYFLGRLESGYEADYYSVVSRYEGDPRIAVAVADGGDPSRR
ncbi:MAG TPA: methyltransferase domain-containing protein [Egibacteraceae bacterium]|nr:methyltransferase domain-containing protein [Egibacteraceae bacterium]